MDGSNKVNAESRKTNFKMVGDLDGNGNPLQYSCLENPMDRGAWWVMANGVAELDTTELTSTVGAYLIL